MQIHTLRTPGLGDASRLNRQADTVEPSWSDGA
jgi:hypothetical protein